MSGILVICLSTTGDIGQSYLGLLGGAGRVAKELGEETQAALLGQATPEVTKELIAWGADRVFTVAAQLGDFDTDGYLGAAEYLCRKTQPRLVLILGDDNGRAIAPRLAYRLGAGLVTDCTGFEIENGVVTMLKPVYGGKALAQVVCKTHPQVATVRPKAIDPLPRDEQRSGETVVLRDIPLDTRRKWVEVLERVKEEVRGVRLEDAEIVVSGGRGIGSSEEFAAVFDLARTLGAAVGASRAAVDEGWVPAGLQVGLTGKIIAPKVYIAVGISGASQHVAGVSNARNLVAINADPDAPIFRFARLGVAEDYRSVLPKLGEALQGLMKE